LLIKRAGFFATANDTAALAASPEFRDWRLESREERLSCIEEPLETVTYSETYVNKK
jgi:hypothetical protein